MRQYLHLAQHFLLLFSAQLLRTFRYDDDVGTFHAIGLLAQIAQGHHSILVNGPVVIHHQNGQTWHHLSVLEGIVKQHHLCLRKFVQQSADAPFAFFLHRHGDIRKFAMHLQRFVANAFYRAVFVGQHEAFGFAFIAAAQNGQAPSVFEQSYQIFGVRGLPGAAYGEVANAYNGDKEPRRRAQSFVESSVTYFDNPSVQTR